MDDQARRVDDARQQVAAARALMPHHQPAGNGLCICGRQSPCSVSLACTRTYEHHRDIIAMLQVTVELPMRHTGI